MLIVCQSGFETLLARELTELRGATVEEKGPGWVRMNLLGDRTVSDLAFSHLALAAPVEIRGDSVNALAQRIAEFFFASLRG